MQTVLERVEAYAEDLYDAELIKQWITRWEGVRSKTYRDSRNIPTIGVGFNLTTGVAREAVTALGLEFEEVLSGAVSLKGQQIDRLLSGSIQTAVATALAVVPRLNQLPPDQRLVLIDLAFNMGQHTLSKFSKMLDFIEKEDWTDAAASLRDSAWFEEVGQHVTQRGGADVAVLGGTAKASDVLRGSFIGTATFSAR